MDNEIKKIGPVNDSTRSKIIRILYQPYKYLVFIPLLCLSTTVFGSLAILLATLFNAGIGMRFAAGPWARLNCLAAGVFVTVKNKKNIIPDQSYVVVANHQSLFDILILVGRLGIDLRWVAKASLKTVPMFGTASVKMDHIFIDRSNSQAALETLNTAKKNIVDGTSVMFFPEGTRSRNGNLTQFKHGAFKMALDLGIPILPITVQGTRFILPSGTVDLLPGKAGIVIHPQIDVSAYTHETIRDLVQETHSLIKSALV